MTNCTTHHKACDCREAMFAEMVEANRTARHAVQAFFDMVNVIQRVQALPIPSILETAQHNCPIILAQIDDAIARATDQGEMK